MAPTEEEILTNFLLLPSSLPTIISLEEFTELFPKRLRSHGQIRVLYRELQHVRAQDTDLVRENIDKEIRRGEREKEELQKANATSGIADFGEENRAEMDIDAQLFGQPAYARPENFHTSESFLDEMKNACEAVEHEISFIRAENKRKCDNITSVVGDLSDLRYGKFNKPAGTVSNFVDETIQGLNQLEKSINEKQ